MSTQHLDSEILRELQIVMGDEFAHLLQTFVVDSVARIAAVQEAAAIADSDALRRAAHSFKGSSGNMGALRLCELCHQIEECARRGEVDPCLPLIAQLDQEFALVQNELEQFKH